MNREQIIQMAREAGFVSAEFWPENFQGLFGCAERFATLVAAAEREACAKVVEDIEPSPNPIINMAHKLAAADIRARGQA